MALALRLGCFLCLVATSRSATLCVEKEFLGKLSGQWQEYVMSSSQMPFTQYVERAHRCLPATRFGNVGDRLRATVWLHCLHGVKRCLLMNWVAVVNVLLLPWSWLSWN